MRALLAWIAFIIGLPFVVVGIVRWHIDGAFLFGVVMLALWLVGLGAHRREWWSGPDPDPEVLSRLDELDREAYARAAYEAALEAQRRGAPSSEKARILIAYAEEWERVCAARRGGRRRDR